MAKATKAGGWKIVVTLPPALADALRCHLKLDGRPAPEFLRALVAGLLRPLTGK